MWYADSRKDVNNQTRILHQRKSFRKFITVQLRRGGVKKEMMISLHTLNNYREKYRERNRMARVFSSIYGKRTDGWQKVTPT